MRATIDSAKCMGHGMCYSLAPNVFTDDDRIRQGILLARHVANVNVLEARN